MFLIATDVQQDPVGFQRISISQTVYVCRSIDPLGTTQLIGKYGSPMECIDPVGHIRVQWGARDSTLRPRTAFRALV